MEKVKRVIFLDTHGTTRAPMAAEIMKTVIKRDNIKSSLEILARGIVVHFPEPINQKAEAVLAGNGIIVSNYVSKAFFDEEVDEKTLVFTFDERLRQIILKEYEVLNEENTYVLSFFVGEELETFDPLGEPIGTYGLCYEALKETTRKLLKKLGELDE